MGGITKAQAFVLLYRAEAFLFPSSYSARELEEYAMTTRSRFVPRKSAVSPGQPVFFGPEGLEQIRRYGMEPFIEKCRQSLGPQTLGRAFQIKPRRPQEQDFSLYRLGDKDAFFLCRGLPAADPERCYIKARKNGRIYYVEETQAPAALGGNYEILYCMLGKELAGAVCAGGRADAAPWPEAL